MLRLAGIIVTSVLLTACGSTSTKTEAALKNKPVEAAAATVQTAKPKQVCRLEKQIGTNQKTRVCSSK